MAKKKYKIKFLNLEVTSTCADDFMDLMNMCEICATYERAQKHLSICSIYEELKDSIMCQLGGQA